LTALGRTPYKIASVNSPVAASLDDAGSNRLARTFRYGRCGNL